MIPMSTAATLYNVVCLGELCTVAFALDINFLGRSYGQNKTFHALVATRNVTDDTVAHGSCGCDPSVNTM
jgi:hypothetical protein